MAPKGEDTREMILRKSAQLFNEHGFAGASLSDVMKVTGLQKGGLYNHFASKEDLAVEALDYAVQQVQIHFHALMCTARTAGEKIDLLIKGFENYYEHPPVQGGCPIANAAIDNDDSNPRLRERARLAMDGYLASVEQIFRKAVDSGEIRKDCNCKEVAMVMLSCFEGALMLSKLNGSPAHLRNACGWMRNYVESLRTN
jgi:TetR/AcrR family transcriptional regulator, transcriptional repressor for nem operon